MGVSMETTSHRPWEATSQPPTSQPTQTLPSIKTLTSKLPHPSNDRAPQDLSINPPQRDSGTWMSNGATLTASSTHSNNTMPFLNSAHSPTGPGPSPFSPNSTSSGPFTSPSAYANGARLDPRTQRVSGDFDDSRRSSVTGSIHQGMNNLGLGPTSPYHSNNHSQSSIVSGLQQQRGITNGYSSARHSAMGGPISPYGSQRGGRGGFTAGRVAPPILENPKSEVYSADAPTRGQAYAFPDPDARPGSTFSRRNSFAESFTSSILTMESSRLPPGQHELPNGHHHGMMNKPIDALRDEPDSPNGTPYSRTPELRVTHKLAERKRRSEMKDCFEQLRARLPASSTNKSSKWETLSRAIDYITGLETQIKQQKIDSDKQRHQLQDMEYKLQQMSDQLQRLQHSGGPQSYQPPPPNAMPTSPLGYGQGYGNNNVDNRHDSGANDTPRTLPPLINGAAMQGVQFGEDRR